MATHSSVLGWRIPGTGKAGGLPSMGLHRVGHDWSGLAAAAACRSRTSVVQLQRTELCHLPKFVWKQNLLQSLQVRTQPSGYLFLAFLSLECTCQLSQAVPRLGTHRNVHVFKLSSYKTLSWGGCWCRELCFLFLFHPFPLCVLLLFCLSSVHPSIHLPAHLFIYPSIPLSILPHLNDAW